MVCFYAWKASSHRCNNGGGLVIPNISGSLNCYSGSVDGRHPAPIEVFSASHSFTGFFSSQVVVSDFSPPYSSDVFSGKQTCNWVGATQIIFHFHLYPWGR